jgi:carboxymethylenebutenolidase
MARTITLTTGARVELSAHLAEPEGAPKGAVVVIQEIFGVNDHIRSVADGYAARGYLAIAPALFDPVRTGVELGYDAEGIDVGKDIAFNMNMDDVMQYVEAAVDEVSHAGKVGIVGYCWGGSICYVAAARLSDKLAAASGYYGGQILPYLDERPETPLMLHFGELDQGIPLENVRTIEERWPHVEVFVYEGAGHGFNCDARASYDAGAAGRALDRTLAHFATHLS